METCELLIKKFDDLNAVNDHGHIPFHLAAYNGHMAVCDLIIKVHHSNILKYSDDLNLLEYRDRRYPFYWAAVKGLFKVCILFIKQLKKKNPSNYGGCYSLLHWAAYNGHLEICEYIINNVKDKNPADLSLDTPLHFAAQNGHLEVCQLICDNIKDKEPKNNIGKTPIQLAFDSGHSSIVKILQASLAKKIKLT